MGRPGDEASLLPRRVRQTTRTQLWLSVVHVDVYAYTRVTSKFNFANVMAGLQTYRECEFGGVE